VLARGGYATVYRATQESVSRDVAVKVENRTLESERDRRRFLREARAAGRMSGHPHVIDLFDAGVTADGHPYLIMELCDGSYAERMKISPLSPAETRDVGIKIADALADAHSLGVLHRDVKPANLLLTRFGEPALADFGLAILVESRDTSITLDVLTPAYAPPEMFRHAPPSPAADVYALCATLYALMRGRPPRWDEQRPPSLVSIVDMFGQQIPDIPEVPRELMQLLRMGMANDELSRPTAAQLRDALIALPMPPGTPPISLPTLSPVDPVRIAGPDDPTEQHEPHELLATPRDSGASPGRRLLRRGAPWLALGGALAVVLGLGGALVWYTGNTPDPNPSPTPLAEASATTPSASTSSAAATPSASANTLPIGQCLLAATHTNASCVTTPECFELAIAGKATAVPCDQPHTWEVFATGQLPANLSRIEQQSLGNQPAVRQLCNRESLIELAADLITWQVRSLVPTAAAYRNGDRTFRCVAGNPPAKQTGSRFVRR
jgi:serine/threonine protein kinase